MKKLRNNKGIALHNPSLRIKDSRAGITLIALVITIIVLIILAGVSIALLTGENGILTKATTASEETKKQGALEKVKIAVAGSIDNNGKYNADLAKTNIEKEVEGSIVSKNVDNSLTVKVDGYTIEVSDIGKVFDSTKEGEETEILPSTDTTKPYFPSEEFTKEETDLNTGLVIRDNDGNSYVWVEVPKTIFTTATSNIDYANIEKDMINYAIDYRAEGCTDTWYDGCGLTEGEYNNLKNTMLTSIYNNGGFWISQFELGTDVIRNNTSDQLEKPFSKKGLYPYNYITVSEAQHLAKSMNSGSYNSSLLFGIQWDLTMKYVEVKGNKTQEQLRTDSTQFGNYLNSEFDITKGKYSIDLGVSYKDISGTFTKQSDNKVLLTTGTEVRNTELNIYDLAGNLWEWTLEKSSVDEAPASYRGACFDNIGSEFSQVSRNKKAATFKNFGLGIRVALY